MAGRVAKMVKKLRQVFNQDQVTQVSIETTDVSYRSYTDVELKRFINETYVKNSDVSRQIDHMQIPAMLEPISRELIDRKADHAKLMSLAPEIEQAASILIPSILSPNDFRKNIFLISIESQNESEKVISAITELVTKHFGDHLNLATKLSDWINDAMFRVGSKSIMILPTKTISDLKNQLTGTNESLGAAVTGLYGEIEASLEHFGSDKVRSRTFTDDDIVNKAMSSEIFSSMMLENHKDGSTPQSIERKVRTYVKSGIEPMLKKLSEKKPVLFVNDLRALLQPQLCNVIALEAIDSKILAKLGEVDPKIIRRKPESGDELSPQTYKSTPYLDLSNIVKDDDVSSYPAMIDIPSEAVIPISIEGSPSNHIGYYVLLNENGTPLSMEADGVENQSDGIGSQRINNMYTSFYGNANFSMQKRISIDAKREILNSVYDSYLKGVFHAKLDDMGFSKYKVNLAEDLSRVMFYRLLKNAETRILYVPKKLMMYLAFDYHGDGTGRSKIDNIKFPLSLKITLIITRLISLIESSINRRKLNITLDESIGNPLEILRTVKKTMTANKMYGITYDPSSIIKSVLDKELTIVPNKIPGVEEFSLTDEANNVDYPRPDDAILEEINNMYMLSLGVPPSAMNRLSEDEFSRSVASNNIFFSNQLKTYQTVICSFMSTLIVTYINYSSKLKGEIQTIIKNDTGSTTGDDPKTKMKPEARVADILNTMKFTLPSPNLAQDKSAFDELKDYIEIIDTVLQNTLGDELIGDGDLGGTIKTLRANIKREILQEHIKTNSILSELEFDGLANVDIVAMVNNTQKLKNLKAALDAMQAKLGAESGGDATGGESSGGEDNWGGNA